MFSRPAIRSAAASATERGGRKWSDASRAPAVPALTCAANRCASCRGSASRLKRMAESSSRGIRQARVKYSGETRTPDLSEFGGGRHVKITSIVDRLVAGTDRALKAADHAPVAFAPVEIARSLVAETPVQIFRVHEVRRILKQIEITARPDIGGYPADVEVVVLEIGQARQRQRVRMARALSREGVSS